MEQSRNINDFSGILDAIVEVRDPILCAISLRFIKQMTNSYIRPILEVAQFSSIRKVELERVLNFGIDLNLLGANPISDALFYKREDLALLLLEKGFDPLANDNMALKSASRGGFLEVVKVLIKKHRVDPSLGNGIALRLASNQGHLEIVRFLLGCPGVDPAVDNSSALRFAVLTGNYELIKLLLGQPSVDPSANDNDAIKQASRGGYLEIVELLLEQDRVNPSAGQNEAIQSASLNGHLEVVKALLDRVGIEGAQIALDQEDLNHQEIREVLQQYIENNS